MWPKQVLLGVWRLHLRRYRLIKGLSPRQGKPAADQHRSDGNTCRGKIDDAYPGGTASSLGKGQLGIDPRDAKTAFQQGFDGSPSSATKITAATKPTPRIAWKASTFQSRRPPSGIVCAVHLRLQGRAAGSIPSDSAVGIAVIFNRTALGSPSPPQRPETRR
jgi:hypothetical protein